MLSEASRCTEHADNGMVKENGASSLPPPGELSATESSFLERSRRFDLEGSLCSSGIRGEPILGGEYFESVFRSGGGCGQGESGNVAIITALRDRLNAVEADNAALRKRAQKAEKGQAQEAARGDKATRKLMQAGVDSSLRWSYVRGIDGSSSGFAC